MSDAYLGWITHDATKAALHGALSDALKMCPLRALEWKKTELGMKARDKSVVCIISLNTLPYSILGNLIFPHLSFSHLHKALSARLCYYDRNISHS